MLTIVQHYNKTGEIDLNLPWFEFPFDYANCIVNLTEKQESIRQRLIADGLDSETALVLASRFEDFGEDDDGYRNVKDAVPELFLWYKQPEGIKFWIAYDAEHKKKYNP